MKRVRAAVLALAGLMAGCYGSTEPATNIGEDSATLNAQGTANNGPATSHFEFWTDGDPLGISRRSTPSRSWPAGASGPISERVFDLLVASEYSFRLCGSDQGGSQVCAQTRTLRTPTPPDYVKGSVFDTDGILARFNARSGAAGENARGTARTTRISSANYTVSCLAVAGNRAIIGGVGDPELNPVPVLFAVQDGPDSWGARNAPTNPPNCSSFTFDQIAQRATNVASLVVHDTP